MAKMDNASAVLRDRHSQTEKQVVVAEKLAADQSSGGNVLQRQRPQRCAGS